LMASASLVPGMLWVWEALGEVFVCVQNREVVPVSVLPGFCLPEMVV